jgi:hypothetical protein
MMLSNFLRNCKIGIQGKEQSAGKRLIILRLFEFANESKLRRSGQLHLNMDAFAILAGAV